MISLIAEIGWNHMGDLDLANKMIVAAKKSGATHAKFQTWHEKNLKPGPWDQDGRREIYKKAELSIEDFKKLKSICDQNKINFLTSVFTLQDVEPMSKIYDGEIKIPSHEIANVDLIKECSKFFNKIYLSTGASLENELLEANNILKESKIEYILMHCVSSYPCNDEKVNLPRIDYLKKIHTDVGFSDHSSDILAATISLAKGLKVIEKHFTVDRELPGRDNKFAILPDQLLELSNYINRFENINVDHGVDYQKCEEETVNVYRGRWSK